MRKTAVILRFNSCSRLCSHLGISLCLFEFCRTVARSVVLLEDFHGSARWDVLPVGREVRLTIRVLECSRPGVSTFDSIGGDMAEAGGVTMLLQLQQWNLCLRLP
jgi:hypothetical protein